MLFAERSEWLPSWMSIMFLRLQLWKAMTKQGETRATEGHFSGGRANGKSLCVCLTCRRVSLKCLTRRSNPQNGVFMLKWAQSRVLDHHQIMHENLLINLNTIRSCTSKTEKLLHPSWGAPVRSRMPLLTGGTRFAPTVCLAKAGSNGCQRGRTTEEDTLKKYRKWMLSKLLLTKQARPLLFSHFV